MLPTLNRPALQNLPLAPARVSLNYDVRVPLDAVRTGGDFCVCDRQADGSLWSVLGDVSAKGERGVALARSLVATFHIGSLFAQHASVLLRQLNATLLYALGSDAYEECFATALVCCFHCEQGYVEYAAAGAEAPLITSESGIWTQSFTGGLVLGMDNDVDYHDVIMPFGPGATLVAFTDGVSESRVAPFREREVGDANVLKAVDELARRGTPTAQKVLARIDGINAGCYEDDATLIVASAVAS